MAVHVPVRTADFDYDLPPELIAQEPAEPRDSARMLVLERTDGCLSHRRVRDLPKILRRGDLVVVNDTRVMAARLSGYRPGTGGRVEALLVHPTGTRRWLTLFRPARQAVPGRTLVFETSAGAVAATVVGREGGEVELAFAAPIDPESAGSVPLPPYIRDYRGDPERYQTVYSREARSAAAPTAGLHFTEELLDSLRDAGVGLATVTLDVGPGTFVPVTAEDPRDHQMHAEHVTVPAVTAAAIASARSAGGRVVAVGTTVVRTLEHVARECDGVREYEGWTALKLLPGDDFLVVDALLTNFHLPRSTLLMLVSAFAGREKVLAGYEAAVRERYRFYSFGDAMLLV